MGMIDTTRTVSRRTALAASFAGAAALALSACERGTLTKPAPADTLSLFNDNPSWTPGYHAAGTELRRLGGYRLAPQAVPNVSNYQQIVRMSAQTDSTADLVKWWNGYRLRDVARAGILADVTGAWDEAKSRGWCDDPALRETFTADGRQYGVPLYKSYYAVFYSKPVFARLGVGVPTTWQEFLHVVDTAHARHITPISSGGATSWESSIWFQQLVNGLDHRFYLDLAAGKRSYTDAECRQAMGVWSDLYRRGAFSSPDASVSDLPGRFAQGTTAMCLHGTWNTGAFLTAGIKNADLGAFLLPRRPAGGVRWWWRAACWRCRPRPTSARAPSTPPAPGSTRPCSGRGPVSCATPPRTRRWCRTWERCARSPRRSERSGRRRPSATGRRPHRC